MAEDASPENKAVYAAYQKMLQQASRGELSSFILPLLHDDNGNRMFEFDIKSLTGTKTYDVNTIIKRYSGEILTALFADFLTLGNTGGGSYSLSESKLTVVEMGVQAKLDEIKDQLNHDLLRQLFELNGWDTDVMPTIEYGQISKPSLEEVSKFVQRVTSVGTLPKTRETINWVLSAADIPFRIPKDMTQEELMELVGEDTSRGGEGMAKGSGNGTSDSVAGRDSSVSNQEA